MRKAIFPFLIAIHPVIASFAGGGKWEPIEDSLRPGIVLLVIFLFIWCAIAGLVKDWLRSAYITSAFWFFFFAFGDVDYDANNKPFWLVCGVFLVIAIVGLIGIARAKQKSIWMFPLFFTAVLAVALAAVQPIYTTHMIYAAVWCVITLIYATWAGTSVNIEKHVGLLNVIAIGFFALPVYMATESITEAMRLEKTIQPVTLQTGNAEPAGKQPDVYLFVLDAYGRADAIKRVFGFDNTPFIKELNKRGFFVAKNSHSNYAQTEQVFASELNGNYLSTLLPKVDPNSRNRSLLNNLADDNAIERAMQAHGYKYMTVSTGFPLINRDSDHEQLSDPPGMSLAEILVAYRTPEAGLCLFSNYFHQVHRDRILNAFHGAATLPSSPQPKFVLVHILAPHPPFVFDKDGHPTNPQRQFGLWDANGFVYGVGSGEEYFEDYPQQLQYVNKLVLDTIDRIQSHSDVPPVIILEGDHGSRKGHSMQSIEQTDPTESFENLIAVAGPQAVKDKFYDSITPVNIPRALVSGLFGGPFQKLPDRSIYSTWRLPYQYLDITDRAK